MGFNTRSTRQSILAITAVASLVASPNVSLASSCDDQQTLRVAAEHQWYLSKARIFERQAARLARMQSRILLSSYLEQPSSVDVQTADSRHDELRRAIANHQARARFAVHALARSKTAHRDWHLMVNNIAGAHGAMSDASREIIGLIEQGDIDGANAVHRAKSTALYDQIERASYTLTTNIEGIMFQGAAR